MKDLMARLAELGDETLLADGFEDALVGICQQFNRYLAVYSYRKCIEILAKDMTEEEAEEFMSFNVVGAWVGEHTPVFLLDQEG